MAHETRILAPRSRQWGTERDTATLPVFHARPSLAKLVWARLAIWITVALWALYMLIALIALLQAGTFPDVWQLITTFSYLLAVTFLTFSACMYLLARKGGLERFGRHSRVPRLELDEHFQGSRPPLTVLVPAYGEEPALVRRTLWSAALQEYPDLRVVLLLDDDPYPSDPADADVLMRTRSIAAEISDALAGPDARFARALREQEQAELREETPTGERMRRVASEYRAAVAWLEERASAESARDHLTATFTEEVLRGLARDLSGTAAALETAAAAGETLPGRRLSQLLRRLVRTFHAEVTFFERKRYASLCHEPNKAMNLNAYIGLMGGRYREVDTHRGRMLQPVDADVFCDLEIPDGDYILTLDADSIVLPEYCLRLVHLLEQPENARVAVAQTPYSSFRGAPTRIERLASATTDVQHILHQGMTAYSATFWVGANAIIRRDALEDIRTTERNGALEVHRYVQDRTVIEDTESSIDLVSRGWSLVNYPERLSYSATPSDFGALVIQRRRWSNGGLLLLPKLAAHLRDRRRARRPVSAAEAMLRTNYLASTAWSTIGLVFLMVSFPFNGLLLSPVLLLIAVPYFASMAADLRDTGYRRRDVVGVYSLNLLLLAVCIAGVLGSLRQAVTQVKSGFSRTPKVETRTVAPALFVLAPALIVVFSVLVGIRSVNEQAWGTLVFSAINALCAAAALIWLVGIRGAIADMWIGWIEWLWVDARSRSAEADTDAATVDWRATLDDGVLGPQPAAPGRRRRPRRGRRRALALRSADEGRKVSSR